MSVPLTPQGAPLTEEEQKTVARLFSDPFFFPLQFKTWLQWFIEGVQGNIAGGSGPGGVGGGGGTNVPIGGILPFAGPASKLPTGFLFCNGAAYSRTTYNPLYAIIGTAFGVGDGSTTFNVPDLDGRSFVGWAQAGGHVDVATLGASEGLAKSSRRPKHKHTVVRSVDVAIAGGGSHTHGMTGHRTVYAGEAGTGAFGVPGFDVAGINDFAQWAGSGGNVNTIPSRPSDVGTDAASVSISISQQPVNTVGPQTGAEPVDSDAYLVLAAIIRYV